MSEIRISLSRCDEEMTSEQRTDLRHAFYIIEYPYNWESNYYTVNIFQYGRLLPSTFLSLFSSIMFSVRFSSILGLFINVIVCVNFWAIYHLDKSV